MLYLILGAILVTAEIMNHGSNTNNEMWWLFDDIRWQAERSLEEDAAMAENTLNSLRYYRRR